MLDWTALRDFLAVAEDGSLSAAARRLRVSQPTLGRRIAALEQRLGTQLVNRTPRGLELTEAGEAALAHVRRMEQGAHALELAVSGRDQSLAGSVRITSTETLGIEWLTPQLAELRADHPDIQVELRTDNATLNLLRREADIAVRLGRPQQADLIGRRAGTVTVGLYAAAAYLERAGTPHTADDLKAYRGVGFDDALALGGAAGWLDGLFARERMAFRSNSMVAQLAATRAGYGIGGHSCFIAERYAELRRVVPELSRRLELWLVTHAGLRRSARIRAVFDFLGERLERDGRLLLGD